MIVIMPKLEKVVDTAHQSPGARSAVLTHPLPRTVTCELCVRYM